MKFHELTQNVQELTSRLAEEGWDRMRGLRLLHALRHITEECNLISWLEAAGRAEDLSEILDQFIRESPGNEKFKLTIDVLYGLTSLLSKGSLIEQIDLNNLPENPSAWKFVFAGNAMEELDELADTLATLGFGIVVATSLESLVEACDSMQVILLAKVSWLGLHLSTIKHLLPSATITLPASPLLIALTDTDDFLTQVKVRQEGVPLLFDMPIDVPHLLASLAGLAWMPGTPYRVLIVDDEQSTLNMNKMILEKAGFQVLASDDPVAARDFLEDFAPEACLLDIEMPACRGTVLAALLRRNKRYTHLPVIYLSAFTDIEHQLDARNAGGEDYLVKPADPRLLITAVLARTRQFRKMEAVYFQRRQTWMELQSLRRALDAHASVSIASTDGSILEVNGKFCEVSGYSRKELIGRNHRILKSGHHSRATFNEMWETITSGGIWSGELLNRCKNGNAHWVQNTIVPIFDEQGLPEKYISIRTDITEQKAVQAERELQVRLLELLRQSFDQFVATQNMTASSRLLLDAILLVSASSYGFLGEVWQDQAGKSCFKTHALSDRVSQFERQADFHQLDSLSEQVLRSGETLIVNDPQQNPGWAYHDYPQLKNFLGIPIYQGDHLIGVAGLANRAEGYAANVVESLSNITTTYASILEASRLQNYQQQVIGELQQARDAAEKSHRVKAEQLQSWEQQLRAPLNGLLGNSQILQLNASLDDDARALVAEIFKNGQALAGRLASLNQRIDATPLPAKPLLAPEKIEHANERRLILVAEDNPANQAVLRMQLTVLGFDVDIAADGAVALAKWKQGGHDLILTDRNMPGMDGMELARAIRATEKESGAFVPIIAITALNHPEDIARCLQAGMDDALPKPIELDKLQLMLERWLPQSSPVARVNLEVANDSTTLDLHYLARVVGNIEPKQIRELIDLFTATASGDLPACQVHLSENNGLALAQVMHKLKSSARMVGALRFAGYAERLERAAKAEQFEQAKFLYKEMKNALRDVEEAANQLLLSTQYAQSSYPQSAVFEFAHVLIVDDDAVARLQLSMLLSQFGIAEIETIDNAGQALQLIVQQDEIDLVISDLNMPGMDGIEFLRRLADSGYQKSIILVSGVEEQLLQSAAEVVRAKGMNLRGTLKKPVMKQALRELLDRHLEIRSSSPRAVITVSSQEILQGILHNEFEVHFQPKVDSATLRVVGVESLARWHHAGKMIPPDVFITTAEQNDLIGQLSEVLVTKALLGGAQLAEAGFNLSVAVNLSANWLSDIRLPEFILSSIDQTGFKAENLILEITETGVMADMITAMDVMTRLRLKGFKLSIDDFGTGYSSLEQLQRIPFSELKLDRGFVQGAIEKTSARAILASTIGMAKKLKLSTVAEGVETQADLDLVRGLGCDLVQGWLIAKAMPVAQLIEWLQARKTIER